MKKKLLSLALALAMCLSLMAPAFAWVEASTYESDFLWVSNIIKYDEEWDGFGFGLPIQCAGPVEITVHSELVRSISIFEVDDNYTETEISIDPLPTYEGGDGYTYIQPGSVIQLSVPGTYMVNFSAITKEVSPYTGDILNLPTWSGLLLYIPEGNSTSSPAVATSVFTDVPAGEYYAEPVAWAIERGITNGTSANKFSPEETCSNAQILTFLWRACGEPEPAIGNPYSNVAESDYYYKAALWAYEKGMVSGTTFDADKPCTRAMTVTYIWQASGSPAAERLTAPTASSLSYAPYTISGVNTYANYPGEGNEFAIQFDAAVMLKTKITLHHDEWDPEGTIRDLIDPSTYDITLAAVRPDSRYIIGGGFYGFSYEAADGGEDGIIWINGVPGSPYYRASDGSFRYVTTPMGHDDTEFALYEDSLSKIRLYGSEFSDMGSDGSADCGVLVQLDGTYYFVTYADSAIAAGLLGTTSGSSFSDVPSAASYAQAVAWAVEKGITTGDGANTFSPDKTCTRGQIVTFLYRAFA